MSLMYNCGFRSYGFRAFIFKLFCLCERRLSFLENIDIHMYTICLLKYDNGTYRFCHIFHGRCINVSKQAIEADQAVSGMGLFIDIHGHGHPNDWAELGNIMFVSIYFLQRLEVKCIIGV